MHTNSTNPVSPALFDRLQLANYLSISPRHVSSLDASGKLPAPVRLGRSVRWRCAEIDSWLASGRPSRQQ